jgi:hypothetical protein
MLKFDNLRTGPSFTRRIIVETVQNAATIFTGIVHGKTIELDRAPGLPDGQPVHVTVQLQSQGWTPGDGIRRSAGAWSQDADELNQFLRQSSSRSIRGYPRSRNDRRRKPRRRR